MPIGPSPTVHPPSPLTEGALTPDPDEDEDREEVERQGGQGASRPVSGSGYLSSVYLLIM